MTSSTLDRTTIILHKPATDTEMIVMEGAAVEETFSVVLTVVEDTQIGVETPTKVLIQQGRRMHHRALHRVLILTQEAMVFKVLVTGGNHMAGTQVPVDLTPTSVAIDTVITRTVRIEAIPEVIHMAGMVVDRVQEVGMEDMEDI